MAKTQSPSSLRREARRGKRVKMRALALVRLLAVVAAHGAVMAAFRGSRTGVPRLPTQPLEVSLIAPAAPVPVAEPAPTPAAKPTTPKPEAEPEPVTKPRPQSVARPQPVAQPRPQPVVKPTPRPRPAPAPAAISPPEPAVAAASIDTTELAPAELAVAKNSDVTATRPGTPIPVSRARFDAAYLDNPVPAYPRLSRRKNEHSRVLLRVRVTPEGTAGEVRVHETSGHRRLDEAARNTVARWRFVPAKRGETAIASWVIVPIEFKLEDA